MTAETAATDMETVAVTNFAYAITYQVRSAEVIAIKSPDEIGRLVFVTLADEYREMARLLQTSTREDTDFFYSAKCDLVQTIKKMRRILNQRL